MAATDESPPAAAEGRYAALAVVLASLGSLAVAVFFTRQVNRLRQADYVSEQLLPICTTIAALLDVCDDFPVAAAAALKSLERSSPFRNTWITVFSEAGDVWADSHAPTTGSLPMPPCPSQRAAFMLAKEAADGHTVVRRRVGHCALSGATADVTLAAKMTSKRLLLVVQSCGHAAA
jgi:hypothetical protein